jgi:hypothetical protein
LHRVVLSEGVSEAREIAWNVWSALSRVSGIKSSERLSLGLNRRLQSSRNLFKCKQRL